MENWIDTFEHSSLATPEAQTAFKSAMSNYASIEDAVVGGFNAKKEAGRNFKLPKTIESLPDETMRQEFTSRVHKLLGIEHAVNVEALADLDMKTGLAEGTEVDETRAGNFKAFVVENKVPKAIAQKLVGYHNEMMAKARMADATQREAKKLADAKTTNEALIAHSDFGSAEKVEEQSELLRRAIQNCPGITPEEYEEVGEELANSIMTKNHVMARILLKLLAPLAAESSEAGGKGKPPTKTADPDEGSPSYVALGWSAEGKKK